MAPKKAPKKAPKTARSKTSKKPARKKPQHVPPAGKVAKRYVSGNIAIGALDKVFSRADIVFDGVDHSGVSYEGRVFLNNEAANEQTPKTARNGYAGSFHIFGHGGCFGDVGHCDVHGLPRPYDPRPAHPLTPARKVVIATDAIRQAIKGGKQVKVTIVPVVRAGTSRSDYENVIKFEKISIVTYA
jgi:tyrosinase